MTTMKVVLKLDLDGDKQKQKAMEAVATLHGIDSIAVDMRVQEMTVVSSADPADVLKKLRNSFPATDIVSVGPAKEEKKMDAIKIQDSHPSLPRSSGDHPHLVTAELPSPRKTVEIPERSTEAPVCALVGVMYRLPTKLDGLLRHGHMLPKGADGEIPLIKQDLGVMTAILHDYSNSGAENCTMMIECLMKEVRELSYDIEDCIDQYEHAANSRSGSGFRIPRRKNKITHHNSKTTRLPEKLKRRLWMANKIREFSLRSQQALQRCNNVFDLGGTSTASARCDASFGSWHPTQYGERAAQPVGLDVPMNTLEEWLTKDGEQTLKVASIVGFGGVGKTTLASELYRRIGGQFECLAFVRTSQNPDIRRLLISMLSQVRPNHPPDNWKVHSLIANIRTHLQDKRYLIVIEDVWATSTWDIVNCVLLDGNCCSRILITTEIEDVALKCCGYDSKYVFMMKPLGDDDARKLFFNTAFGPQHQCPPELGEVSNSIIRKCGGLPLATVTIASLLASRMGKPEQWDYINKSLGYGLRTNPTFEGMKPVLNLSYNNLPQHLKPCMLYLSIYQEDQIIWKDDLVKQWIAESFICATEEKDVEEISRSYFDELISSRMIQPVHMNDNNEVLSCTVHCMVLNFIAQKSIEDNFVTAIDHSQTSTSLADKVRRLSLHFGNAEDATTPTNMRLSQVRTLAFFGVFKCVPSIVEFPLLQVLILHLWGDEESISFDLSRISELFRLRYLQVICNVTLELQTQMRGLQYLETLKIDARASTVPSNIVNLPALLHLNLPVDTNLPNDIGRMASLRTLGYFDLSSNSIDNVHSIGELTNLQDLQLTCSTVPSSFLSSSTVPSDYLDSKMESMGLILAKLSNLKSLTLEPSNILDAGPSSMSISCDVWSSICSPPALLQRLEWSPHICTFSSLPKWIGHLGKLCILKFGIRELGRNDVDLLRGLPALTVLSLYVRTIPAERIIFRKGGFLVLKHFEFRCSVPCLQFEADSMPNLRKLKLGFDAHGADQHGTVPVGLEHLSGLKEICAKIGGGGANEPGSRSAKSALSDAIRMHLGRPTVNIQCVDRMFGGKDDQNSLFFDRLNRGSRGSSSRPRRQERLESAMRPGGPPNPRMVPGQQQQPGTPGRSRRRPDLRLPLPLRDLTSLAVPLLLPPPPSSAPSTSSSGSSSMGAPTPPTSTGSAPPAPPPPVELERVRRIGSGAGGTVWMVRHRPTGRPYALKVLYGNHDDAVRRQITREIAILRTAEHPAIVRCHGMYEQAGELQILLEYMDGGSLEGHRIASEAFLADVARQVLSGIAYLHRRHIVHRDIKPSNLLIDSRRCVKIAYVGRILNQTMDPCNSSVGTIAYMSPERINTDLNDGAYDGYAGDIWSFGLSILEFYLGRFPLGENLGKHGDWAALMCAICYSDSPAPPPTTSPEFKSFISCCLQKNPAKRPSATQLLQHRFVAGPQPQPQPRSLSRARRRLASLSLARPRRSIRRRQPPDQASL